MILAAACKLGPYEILAPLDYVSALSDARKLEERGETSVLARVR